MLSLLAGNDSADNTSTQTLIVGIGVLFLEDTTWLVLDAHTHAHTHDNLEECEQQTEKERDLIELGEDVRVAEHLVFLSEKRRDVRCVNKQ